MRTPLYRRIVLGALVLTTALTTPLGAHSEIVSHTTRAVEEAIRGVPNLRPHAIDIETHQGFVRLTGHVSTTNDRNRVEDAVRATPGITTVKNELTVKPITTPTNVGPSARLANEIKSRLSAEHSLGHYTIDVLVSGDATSLIGSVARDEDRAAIERIVRQTPGVKTIYNQITLAPAESDLVVERNVREALARAGDVDLTGLEIAANDGVVTFAGNRGNHRDIDRILSVALMVDGVRGIKSDMVIAPRR